MKAIHRHFGHDTAGHFGGGRAFLAEPYVLMSNVTNVAVLALLTWGSLGYGLLRAAAQEDTAA